MVPAHPKISRTVINSVQEVRLSPILLPIVATLPLWLNAYYPPRNLIPTCKSTAPPSITAIGESAQTACRSLLLAAQKK